MSRPEDRRDSPRVLTDFGLALFSEDGLELDSGAIAHDLSEKGFKIETRAALEKGQVVGFRLELRAGDELRGRARIAWVERTDLSCWAGAALGVLTREERRRVRRVTSPGDVNWDEVLGRAAVALATMIAALLAGAALESAAWREVLIGLAPKAAAAIAMGWALLTLLERRG